MKKKLLLILITAFLQVNTAEAQTNHHYKMYDYSVDSATRWVHLSALTADGGTIVLVGNEFRPAISVSNYGFSLIRFDANGNKLWNNYISGFLTGDVVFVRIVELPDNGFAIAGNTAFNGGGFIIKTDASGNFVFMKNYSIQIYDCVPDPSDDGFLMTTNASNTFSGVIKTNSAGAIMWSDTKNYTSDPDHYYYAKKLNNGNYLAVGVVYNNPSLVNGVGLVACYSSVGLLLWSMGYASPDLVTEFRKFTELADGSILLAGRGSTINVAGSRALLAKIDSTGALIWCKSSITGSNINTYGFTFSDEYLYAAGNYEISGSVTMLPVVIKADAAGQVAWTRVFPEFDWMNDVAYGTTNDFSVRNAQLEFNNYRTFCSTDTALTQSCYIYDTTFTLSTVTMTTVVTTGTQATPIAPVIDQIFTNSSNINFSKTDVCATSGIENLSGDHSSKVFIYPNPASENMTVYLSSAENIAGTEFMLVNSLGETIQQFSLNTLATVVDLTGVNTGIYFYVVKNRQEMVKSGKIIIE